VFYTFNQNNSGGSFIKNDTVCEYVIIEADSAGEANDIAEDKGIYFNGCDKDIDCPCCGDRWYAAWNGDETSEPLIYGKSPEDYNLWLKDGEVYCRVFYKNGIVKEYIK
jgi:hypothetical protein